MKREKKHNRKQRKSVFKKQKNEIWYSELQGFSEISTIYL